MIRLSDVTVCYGKACAVRAISIDAERGEILAMTGPNGSGKSSLLKAIAGIVSHDGKIHFNDSVIRHDAIGYMPQDTVSHASLTVMEAVLLGRLRRLALRVSTDDLAATGRILDELSIGALAHRYLRELSGGQRQLVFLAQALAAEPDILLLDEPISALDLRHQLNVMDIVQRVTRERRLVTLCVLHDLNLAARYASRIALMNQGMLVANGAPEDVLTPPAIATVFGVEAISLRTDGGHTYMIPIRPTLRKDNH